MKFPFEDMPVYQKSLLWMRSAESLCKSIRGRVSRSLADQLSRSSVSVPLNIAEGTGRWHRADKQNFYRIARGSVFECVPLLDFLKSSGHIDHGEFDRHYASLQELAKMLTGLIKSFEIRDSS